jgi:hypothetical protein
MRVIIVCILLVVAVLVGRLSRAVPLLAPTLRAIVAHVPLLLLAVGSAALVAAIVGAVVVLAGQVPAVAGAWRDRRSVTAGRVVLALAVLVTLPSLPQPSSTSWGDLRSPHRRTQGGHGSGWLQPGMITNSTSA